MKKFKKIFSLMLAAILLCSNMTAINTLAENQKKEEVLFSSDFDGNEIIEEARLQVTGAVSYDKVDDEHGKSLKLQSLAPGRAGFIADETLPKGRYKLSFDWYVETYDNECNLRIVSSDNPSDVTNQTGTPVFVRWKPNHDMSLCYNNENWTQYIPSIEKYEIKKWYKVEVFVDTKDREISLIIDGKKYGEFPLMKEIEDLKGFMFWHSVTGASDKGIYADNIVFTREAEDECDYFTPIKVSYEVPEDVYGNNFFSDNLPEFGISYKNRLPYKKTLDMKYTAKSKDGITFFEDTKQIEIEPDGTYIDKVNIKQELFGIMKLDIEYRDEQGKVFTDCIDYTVSNHTKNMPNNKKAGVSLHIYQGRGELNTMLGLMEGAGIGIMRGSDMVWKAVEPAPGVYADKLPEYEETLLNELDRNDIDFLFLWGGRSDYYNVDPAVPTVVADARGYAAAEKYLKQLMKLAKGRIKYVEVTNEYHSSAMVPVYFNRPDVLADITKAAYKGIKAGDPNVKVIAIDEDRWGLYNTGMIPKYFEEIGEEKCYDYVSLHPYVPDMSSYEGGEAKKFFADVKAEMVKYNQPEDTPFAVTELGWGDYNVGYDMQKKAAYTVRGHAYNQAENLSEFIVNYTLVDYAQFTDSSEQEASMGLCKAYNYGAVDVPYLGKEPYVALAYWNGLMAENEYIGKINGLNNLDEDFGYLFKDRLGRDIVMVGMVEDGKKEISLDLGADTAIIADMYGNEKKIKSIDGKFSLNLQPYEITYLIGDFSNLEDIKLGESDVLFSDVDIRIPINGVVNYNVKVPEDFSGEALVETNGFVKEASASKIENGLCTLTFTGNPEFTDGKMTLKLMSGNELYYTRDIKVSYTPSGIIKNYKLENVMGAASMWDAVIDVENIRQDKPISGNVTIDTGGVTRELPEIAPGEVRRIRIPITKFETVENVGAFNGWFNFSTGETLEFSQDEKRIYATFTDTPPVIDGNLNEWSHGPATMYSDSSEQMVMLMTTERWKGADDLSMAIDMRYDLDNVYFAFEVVDDVFYQPFEMTEYWKGDSVQLSIGFNINSANGTGFNIALDPDGTSKNYRTAQENNIGGFGGESAKMLYTDGEQFVRRSGNKTYYEVKIPWNNIDFNPVEISKGMEIYFAAIANDNDGTGRKGYMEYASGVGTGGNKIPNFYKVYLGK